MLNLKGIPVKGCFLKEDSYKEFLEYINDFYYRIVNNYSFLLIKEEAWNNLFRNMVIKNLDKKRDLYYFVFADVNKKLSEVIKKAMAAGKVGLFDNMIEEIWTNEKNARRTFMIFISKLANLEIKLNDEYYDLLKEKSRNFKFLLQKLGISDFNKREFDKYVKGGFDAYISVKPSNKTIKQTIPKANYFYGLLGIAPNEVPKVYEALKGEELKKIWRLLDNIDQLGDIYNLYRQLVGEVSRTFFDKAIVSMKLQEIRDLFEEFNKYKMTESKDATFIYRLKNKVNLIKNVCIPIDNYSEELSTDDLEMSPLFYNYFDLYPGVNEEIRKIVVDIIFEQLNDERKIDINRSINDDVRKKKKTITSDIATLRYTYKKRLRYYLNPCKDIYEAIEAVPELPLDKKREFIDFYFGLIPADRQKNVIRFITGDVNLKTGVLRTASSDFNAIKKQFLYQQNLFLNKKNLIDFVEGIDVIMSPQVMNEIANIVWSGMAENKKELIRFYLNGVRPLSTKDKDIAYKSILSFNGFFKKFVNKVLAFKEDIKNIILTSLQLELDDRDLTFDELFSFYCYFERIQIEFVVNGKMDKREYEMYQRNLLNELVINKKVLNMRDLLTDYINEAALEMQANNVNSL